jgi:hypothetical protein
LETVARLDRSLTGREPTEEEMAGLCGRWSRIEERLAEVRKPDARPSES